MGAQDEMRAWLAFNAVAGDRPTRALRLLRHFGAPSAILSASPEDIEGVKRIPSAWAEALRSTEPWEAARAAVDALASEGASAVTRLVPYGTPDYPLPLHALYDAPLVLYVQGSLEGLDDPAIAVVGTRSCTEYGLRIARRLGRSLGEARVTVVSPLAAGIDQAAAWGALEAGGRVIGVPGAGVAANGGDTLGDILEAIREGRGALIAEGRPSGAPRTYPMRNRILAGLARVTVVVEAAAQSNALITARYAFSQGRDVGAVPGPVDATSFDGCFDLLRSGAAMVASSNDLWPMLPNGKPVEGAPPLSEPHPPPLSAQDIHVLERIEAGAATLDALAEALETRMSEVATQIGDLTRKGLVRMDRAGRLERE